MMLRNWRILVVEDDAILAWELCSAFEDVGAQVVGPAGTIAEAHRCMAQEGVDAAILDVRLQNEDSMALATKLLDQKCPFIFYTGVSEIAFGADDRLREVPVVYKPTRSMSVVGRLAHLVAQISE
jgi:DNA-binding NtrC family response regulator